jgi:hypothetical protein
MTVNEARQIQESASHTLAPLVVDLLKWVNEGIKEAASLDKDYLDLTPMIPPFGGNERTAWFVVMNELKKAGFSIKESFLGKAYAINGNHYAYYVSWKL